jgi:hypothetical protein
MPTAAALSALEWLMNSRATASKPSRHARPRAQPTVGP